MSSETSGTTPPNATPENSSNASLARQLKIYKIFALILLVIVLGGAAGVLIARHIGQPVAILIDGKPIANAHNVAAANKLLARAEMAKVGDAYPASSIIRLQKVQFQRLERNVPLDPDNIAQVKLRNALRINVRAFAILVDGHVSLGLPTNDMAVTVEHLVKEHYAQMPPDAAIIGEPEFAENVEIKPRSVSAALARSSAKDAAPYFWTPPPSKTYTVRRGDTGLAIAHRDHLSLSNFIIANPGVNINKLTPGQQVNVQKMPLLLTVKVQKRFARNEKVLAHVPAAQAGVQRVTYIVTYLNGQEVKRNPISIDTIEPPVARRSI